MKLFFGVPAPPPLAAAAAGLSSDLQQRAARLAPDARISWPPADRFHLTVLFIGSVDERQLLEIGRIMSTPLAEPAFDMTAAGAGVFPAKGRPRVVWAGFSSGRDSFARLQREVFARVAGVVRLEPLHEARPHVTLGRVKDAAGLSAAALLEGHGETPLGALRVDAVTLFESRQSQGSLQYVPLVKTALEGG